jgi:hypothetical protein
MRTISRVGGLALLLGSSLLASAQDNTSPPKEKIVPVQNNDSSLLDNTSYYMAFSDVKKNLAFPEDKVLVETSIYSGNGRGHTKIEAFGQENDNDVRIVLDGWNCCDGYLRSLNVVSDSKESFYQFCTSTIGGEELLEGPYTGFIRIGPKGLESSLKPVSKEEKDKYVSARKVLDKWSRILDIDSYRKKTGWRNIRKFFDSLPVASGRDRFEFWINSDVPSDQEKKEGIVIGDNRFPVFGPNDGESWPNYARASRIYNLNDCLKGVAVRFDEESRDLRYLFEWELKSSDAKTNFEARFIDKGADGSLDVISLGNDELEVFELKDGKPLSVGVTNPPYSADDINAIWLRGRSVYDSALVLLQPEVSSILKAHPKK